jgi:hypothetical protein
MPSKNYKKKPITDKIRPCKLPGCGVSFEPSRENKYYCCRKHNEKHWHLTHPRIYNGKTRTESAYEICGKDFMRRDTVKSWLNYMSLNPCYFEGLGKFNNSSTKGLLDRLYA